MNVILKVNSPQTLTTGTWHEDRYSDISLRNSEEPLVNMPDVCGLSTLNASHRAQLWTHKLVFGTSNFRMKVKQILGQKNLVQNL